MNDMIHFSNHDFVGITILIGLVLWALFVWKEWSLSMRPSFYVRCLIAFISLVSLVMLFLKPVFLNTAKTVKAALLTPGYEKEQLDSLVKQHKGIRQIDYTGKPLEKALDSISQLFVLGGGIPSFDFWQVEHIPTEYLDAAPPFGIIDLKYEKESSMGKRLVVRGIYNAINSGYYLTLANPGGKEVDSVSVATKGFHEFELSVDLKAKGNYIYKILEKDSLGTLVSSEPLPVKIIPREGLRILMINDFPTFESKYLKNFLAETGNLVTVRSQLTKGKFKYEYFNTPRQSFYSLSKKQLKAVDLLIIDAGSLTALGRKPREAIETMIRNHGLGTLILPDETFLRFSSRTWGLGFLKHKTPKIRLEGWPRLNWEKYPYVFKDDFALQQVHGSNDPIISAYFRKGRGRVGSTVVQNSYQVLLKGNSEAYKEFWTELISALGKREEPALTWNSDSRFAYQDEPFSFKIRTSNIAPQVIGEHGRIPLMQNPDIPYVWRGVTYPKTVGWNSMQLETDTTAMLDFYVMDSTNWKSMTANKTRMENKRRFRVMEQSATEKKILTPIRPIWFFLTFVLGMGYLWFVPKLFKN